MKRVRSRVANWPNFRPHNSKGAVKNMSAKQIRGRIFVKYSPKGAEKGPKIFSYFLSSFFWDVVKKKGYVKIYNLSLCTVSYCSQHLFVVVSQLIIIHKYKTFIIGSRFFLPAAEYSGWPGRIILPGVGNTGEEAPFLYRILTQVSKQKEKMLPIRQWGYTLLL